MIYNIRYLKYKIKGEEERRGGEERRRGEIVKILGPVLIGLRLWM